MCVIRIKKIPLTLDRAKGIIYSVNLQKQTEHLEIFIFFMFGLFKQKI